MLRLETLEYILEKQAARTSVSFREPNHIHITSQYIFSKVVRSSHSFDILKLELAHIFQVSTLRNQINQSAINGAHNVIEKFHRGSKCHSYVFFCSAGE